MQPRAPRRRPISLPAALQQPAWTVQGGLLSPTSPALQVHEILRMSHYPTRLLYYDIAMPPSSVIFDNPQLYTLSTLGEAATTPPVQRMYVKVPASRPISVLVSNSQGITILDVLTALHNVFHSSVMPSVTDDTWVPSTSPSHSPERRRAYSDGCISGHVAAGLEPQRQLHFLHGYTTFAGLEVERCEAGAWILHLRTNASL